MESTGEADSDWVADALCTVVVVFTTAVVGGEVHHSWVEGARDLDIVCGLDEVGRQDKAVGHGPCAVRRVVAVRHCVGLGVDEVLLCGVRGEQHAKVVGVVDVQDAAWEEVARSANYTNDAGAL